MPSTDSESIDPPLWYPSIRTADRAAVAGGASACVLEAAALALAGAQPLVWGAFALLVAGFILSRTSGNWGLAVASIGSVIAIAGADRPAVAWIVVLSLVFSLVLRGRRVFVGAPIAGLALYAATVGSERSGFGDPLAYVALSTTIAAAATASAVRTHERYLTALRQRADDLLASREVELTRRLAEERLRIAQDLHDVVGHEVAVIGMSLGVIDVRLPAGADTERDALRAAQAGVRRVLQEMQGILGILRRGDRKPAASLAVPSVERIPELVQALRQNAVEVRLSVQKDDEVRIAPAADVAAYRITQEAITNAHRHGMSPIDVRVHLSDMGLTLEIENRVGVTHAGTRGPVGYGLVGMRERAEAAGGRLRIETSDETFLVRVDLPTVGGAA